MIIPLTKKMNVGGYIKIFALILAYSKNKFIRMPFDAFSYECPCNKLKTISTSQVLEIHYQGAKTCSKICKMFILACFFKVSWL